MALSLGDAVGAGGVPNDVEHLELLAINQDDADSTSESESEVAGEDGVDKSLKEEEEEDDEDSDSIRRDNDDDAEDEAEEPLEISAVPEVVRPLRQVIDDERLRGISGRQHGSSEEGADGDESDSSLSTSRSSRLLRTLRKSGRRVLFYPLERFYEMYDSAAAQPYDILSITIHCQMWHITDAILAYLDAVSLKTCEEVCRLWQDYIRGEKIWRKLTQRAALRAPLLARQNGWSRHLPALDGKEPKSVDVFKEVC